MVALNRKDKGVKLTPMEAAAVASAILIAAREAPPPEEVADVLEAVLDRLYDKFKMFQCEDCGGLHAE